MAEGQALPQDIPASIGRYRVLRLLGEGGYGRVLLARDDQLERDVAIKVPQPDRLSRLEDLAQYFAEARVLAQLNHPGIVPVFDVGRTPDGLCYVVSRHIAGKNLAMRLQEGQASLAESLSLVADIAEALGHAHARGLVHRDVKPANILLESGGKAVLADFGLALREREFGSGDTLTGTPAYMSPEQARGEGHRVDARSDLFSLGVVLFELLTGRLPFQASTPAGLIDKIATADAPSPRQFKPTLPVESERICLKALAQRASDRYSTACDFAAEVRHLLEALSTRQPSAPEPASVVADSSTKQSVEPAASPATPCLVPKGLRSFDKADAKFFLELLPGPRDIDGLPESIRFWKSRVESAEFSKPFSVGLIYGPSGCGKSSLMKAGLLPKLSPEICRVYVEATSDDTESRLCRELRGRLLPEGAERDTLRGVPQSEAGAELVRMLTELRREAPTRLKTPRAYLSSSHRDLVEHRSAVFRAVQTAGLDCSAMEYYPAAGKEPLNFCLTDVGRCDVYIGIFAHRYGFVPEGETASITELEYREARRLGLETLIFLIDPQAEWAEELRETGLGAEKLKRLRKELETGRMVSYFKGQDELASKVASGIAHWLLRRSPERENPVQGKTLLVIDQFEQWLHTHRDLESQPLVAALRQCDGRHLQAIVMIRDDFYMPVTRFFEKLDIRLNNDHNQSAIDLFDVGHARKLLAAFGHAYGQLPAGELSPDPQAFIDRAADGLAEESRVVCVRLALFCEMMKSRPWTEATFNSLGGVSGVGVTFLEESFSAKSAPMAYRRHEAAARRVLQALLPEGDTVIKGHRRLAAELLAASGYEHRPTDFADLSRVLDADLKLITPVDQDDTLASENVAPTLSPAEKSAKSRYYQLTHDYLVPSLRTWLTSKQGRAERTLVERTAAWTARPENRQLPSLWQWIQIRRQTSRQFWTPSQRRMMAAADRYFARASGVLGVLIVMAVVSGFLINRQFQAFVAKKNEDTHKTVADEKLKALLGAPTAQVPELIKNLGDHRQRAEGLLKKKLADDKATPKEKLHARLALLSVDPSQFEYLYASLLDAPSEQVVPILQVLPLTKSEIKDQFWQIVGDPPSGKATQRLRAAAALAASDPSDDRWILNRKSIAQDLVRENPVFLGDWNAAFESVRPLLIAPLGEIFRSQESPESERLVAANLLADYAADDVKVLADLLMDADQKQSQIIFPKFDMLRSDGVDLLENEVLLSITMFPETEKERLAKRQANAAATLLRLNAAESVWSLLEHSKDPRVRSYLIHRVQPLGVEPSVLWNHLATENHVSIQRALLHALGEYNEAAISIDARKEWTPKLWRHYHSRDPGLHAAAEWLLRKWHADESPKHLQFHALHELPAAVSEVLQWYVSGRGQSMIVVNGPVTFRLGAPATEEGRGVFESLPYQKRIRRTFAIADKAVTIEQFKEFSPRTLAFLPPSYKASPSQPMIGISWYMAARYCNWLSRIEGIDKDEWCYEDESSACAEITDTRIKLKSNFLSLHGYRMPTEAEMEFVTRAGSNTSRFFGETPDLLDKYAWFSTNSAQNKGSPVGLLKPNDFGFFDIQGNVHIWCCDAYSDPAFPARGSPFLLKKPFKEPDDGFIQDDIERLKDADETWRMQRGGTFETVPFNMRSAFRSRLVPTNQDAKPLGIRVARTIKDLRHAVDAERTLTGDKVP